MTASWEHEDAGLIPDPAQWAKDLVLPQLPCRSPLQPGSDPWPRNSMRRGAAENQPPKTKAKKHQCLARASAQYILPTRRTIRFRNPNTHHHHGDPNAHGANDVELVLEDLFDGLRAGLRRAEPRSRSHTVPASGSPPAPPPSTHFIPRARAWGLADGWEREPGEGDVGGGAPKAGQDIRDGRGVSPGFGGLRLLWLQGYFL